MTDLARRLPVTGLDPARLARRRGAAAVCAFLACFAILVFAVETLSQVGVGETILIWLVAAFALAVPALAAVTAPTISHAEFAFAGRKLSAGVNAAATAIGLFGSVFAIGIAALVVRSEAQMAALALGLCGGCLLSGILFAPYVRRGAAGSIGTLLGARFGRGACAVSGIVAGAALFLMLVAELSVAARVGSWTFGFSEHATMAAVAILMLAPPLIGGMRGITRAGVIQFTLLFVALVPASFWISSYATGYALPIAGYVVTAGQLQAAGAAGMAGWDIAGFGLCVSLGVAALPSLLARPGAAVSSQAQRTSIAWTLLIVAVLAVASASMASIARWIVYESPARSGSIAEVVAQPWIVDWITRDAAFVTLCGETAGNAGSACAAGPLKAGDLAISPEIALVAAPEIAAAPSIFAMLVSIGCLVAAIGSGSLLVFAWGRSVGHDLLFRGMMPRTPPSLRLLGERLTLVLAIGAAFHVATDPPADYLALALASLSLCASGLFPVLLAAVWWRRANQFGAVAGMFVGFAIALYAAAAVIVEPALLVWLEPAGLADLARDLGAERSAIVAVPAGVLVIVLVSLATPRPAEAERRFADALLSPRDLPGGADGE